MSLLVTSMAFNTFLAVFTIVSVTISFIITTTVITVSVVRFFETTIFSVFLFVAILVSMAYFITITALDIVVEFILDGDFSLVFTLTIASSVRRIENRSVTRQFQVHTRSRRFDVDTSLASSRTSLVDGFPRVPTCI